MDEHLISEHQGILGVTQIGSYHFNREHTLPSAVQMIGTSVQDLCL